jgi:hypothetical protein
MIKRSGSQEKLNLQYFQSDNFQAGEILSHQGSFTILTEAVIFNFIHFGNYKRHKTIYLRQDNQKLNQKSYSDY